MAKLRTSLIAVVASAGLVLTACSNGDSADSTTASATGTDTTATASAAADSSVITVEDNFGEHEISLPVGKVVSTDNRTFEVLAEWGVDLVAAPKVLVPFTVTEYRDNEEIVNIGNHREPDLEALTAAQPDLIINGQRFTSFYEDIKTLNPQATILEFEPREGEPLADELIRQVTELGKVFQKEDEAQVLVDNFNDALERAKAAYNSDETVMAVNVSGGTIGYIAPSIGRTYGPLFDLLGLTPALSVDDASSNHMGDDISVEAIAAANPAWILVLDRDAGTSTRDTAEYKAATAVIDESEALRNVAAIQDGKVVYAPADTYTNESIITYTEILNDLADAFEAQKN